jgi:hypothetical protein
MSSITTSSTASSLISLSSIASISISWPLVLFSESPRLEARGLPGAVFLPETSALITCYFYVENRIKFSRKQKKNDVENGIKLGFLLE